MSQAKLEEFDRLLEFANDVLHATYDDTDIATINDGQLREYARRTLAFVTV